MRSLARLYAQDGTSYSLQIDDDGTGVINHNTPEGIEIEVSGSQDDVIEYFINMLAEQKIGLAFYSDEDVCECDECVCDDGDCLCAESDESIASE